MFKKILSIFLVLLLSLFSLFCMIYDNLFISYKLNDYNIISSQFFSKKDDKILNTLEEKYVFFDGSITKIIIKWLNISKSKLDFKTNYKWIISKQKNISNFYLENKNINPYRFYSILYNFFNNKKYNLDKNIVLNNFVIIYNNIQEINKFFYKKILLISNILVIWNKDPPLYYIFNYDIIW